VTGLLGEGGVGAFAQDNKQNKKALTSLRRCAFTFSGRGPLLLLRRYLVSRKAVVFAAVPFSDLGVYEMARKAK
jgi:hypothetical protein